MRKTVEKESLNIFGDVECASGGRTKYGRTSLGLPEEHHYDAQCLGTIPQSGDRDRTHGNILYAKCIGRGTRYRSKHEKSGIIVQKQPKGANHKRRFGFQIGDIVRAVMPKGKYKGTHRTGHDERQQFFRHTNTAGRTLRRQDMSIASGCSWTMDTSTQNRTEVMMADSSRGLNPRGSSADNSETGKPPVP